MLKWVGISLKQRGLIKLIAIRKVFWLNHKLLINSKHDGHIVFEILKMDRINMGKAITNL
jgi:hypothetical protein